MRQKLQALLVWSQTVTVCTTVPLLFDSLTWYCGREPRYSLSGHVSGEVDGEGRIEEERAGPAEGKERQE